MIRGEIWTVAGGVYASKPWPAVIVQDDLFDSTLSVVVAPMTSRLVDAPDKLTAVRRPNVLTRVGRLTSDQLVEVERSLMAFLGLAR
ncbi:type II toxin-antitoxin system PemK/MazF family toxin [Gordonia sp. L191]|uniref:type II toxin-antitoxin system PemK/MazF family toxin n=1 Tax=Gordonia sp. L191 TaxID=2982699 RepID=UPI0024BFD192|nr:type II toxin-antitoxin system PemK/MazF family toxin [Gordonia sp. L191]WHU49319.1 type II toxin-antitoxin system PemK/MazF family toxin [Gordonia sp. L191]